MARILLLIISVFLMSNSFGADLDSCSLLNNDHKRLYCYDSINPSGTTADSIFACRNGGGDSNNMRLYCYDNIMNPEAANINSMGAWQWILGVNDLQGMPPMWSVLYTETRPDKADVAIVSTKEKGRSPIDTQSFSLNLSCVSGKPGIYIDGSGYASDASFIPYKLRMTDVWFSDTSGHWHGWVKYGNKIIFSPYDENENISEFMNEILSGKDMHAVFMFNGELKNITFQTNGLDEAIKPFKQCFSSLM